MHILQRKFCVFTEVWCNTRRYTCTETFWSTSCQFLSWLASTKLVAMTTSVRSMTTTTAPWQHVGFITYLVNVPSSPIWTPTLELIGNTIFCNPLWYWNRYNKANTTAANALAPCVARSSATMILTMQDTHALDFHEEGFKPPCQCWEWVKDVDMFLCFLN